MPKLPMVEQSKKDRTVPSLELPRPGPESFGLGIGKALGELGETFRSIDEEIRGVEEAGATSRIIQEASVKLDDKYKRLSTEADYKTFGPLFTAARTRILEEAQEQTKGLRPRAQKFLMPHLDRIGGHYEILANDKSRELLANHEIADVNQAINVNARLAARAELPGQREYYSGLGLGHIKSVTRFIGEPEVVKKTEEFKKKIATEREKYFTTDLQDRLDDLSNRARREPTAAGTVQREGEQLIEIAAGDWLPPEKLAAAKSSYRVSVWDSAVRANIETDPVQARKELQEGKYDSVVDKQHLEALLNRAETEIEKREQKAKAERKEREKEIGKTVADYKESVMLGHPWRGPVSEAKLGELAKGTEHEGDFLFVREASQLKAGFFRATPVEQKNFLNAQRNAPKTGQEAKLFKMLEEAHTATVAALEKDPLAFFVRQFNVPVSPLKLEDPESLRERSRLAGMAEQHYGRLVSPLFSDEVDEIRTAIDQAPADRKVKIFGLLKQGMDDRQVKAVAGQIEKKDDRVTALALGISVDAPDVASRILKGREILKDNPKIIPAEGALAGRISRVRDEINQLLGDAYVRSWKHQAAVRDAALAIYAFKSWQERDLSGQYDATRMETSVREATGGLLTISRGFFGGSYKIQPPKPGMTEAQFLDLVKTADFSKAKNATRENILRHGIFESAGDGKYLIRFGVEYLHDAATGEEFVLDLSQSKTR